MSEEMDEETRRAGADLQMEIVMAHVHAHRLVPAVLICLSTDGETVAVLPCGPAPREQIMALVRRAGGALE